MFKKILVPLDRSPLAEQAIGQAAAIARGAGASIDLVLVHQPMPFGGFADMPWSEDQWADENRYLTAIADEIRSGADIPVSTVVLRGEPVEMICRRVWDVGADLIVMTSHGRTGLSRSWFGSVADSVIRHASVPVLILRPIEGKSLRTAAHHNFTRIVVPLDGSALAADVLVPAASVAAASGGRIMLLRIVQPVPLVSADVGMPFAFPPMITDEAVTEELAETAKQELGAIARQLKSEGVHDVEASVIIADHVAPAIIDFARVHGADLIAMATHGRGAARYLMGSVADKVLRAGNLPTLLNHPLSVASGIPAASAAGVAMPEPAVPEPAGR